MLVEMAGVHGIPTIQLRDDRTEVNKPVHLDRFPIGTGAWAGTRRHTSAIFLSSAARRDLSR